MVGGKGGKREDGGEKRENEKKVGRRGRDGGGKGRRRMVEGRLEINR